ncbi:monovalent cation/H(+) antiporter subunit G [Corynebacterium sp. 335C]
MTLAVDIVSLVLILGGALVSLTAALGVVRFRDTVSRMHASSKPQTLGLLMTIVGVILHVLAQGGNGPAQYGDLGMMALVALFALATAPVVANRLGDVGKREQLIDRGALSRDDEAAEKEAREGGGRAPGAQAAREGA